MNDNFKNGHLKTQLHVLRHFYSGTDPGLYPILFYHQVHAAFDRFWLGRPFWARQTFSISKCTL